MKRPDISGQTIAGKFKLLERLGSGNFGDVYRGTHTIVERTFALKVIPISSPGTGAIEAQLQEITKHDHTTKVQSAEFWHDGNEHFYLIEMEYIPGGSLQDLIGKEGSVAEICRLMKDILFALDHAHQKGVVHRDVKPGNILLGKGGKLSDFGIAMIEATGTMASDYIYSGNLAPECFGKYGEFSAQSDVFAAGLTLLRALNLINDWKKARADTGDWSSHMRAGKFVAKLGFHARVPQKMKRLINKACNPDKSKRYSSAIEFRNDLEKLQFLRNWRALGKYNWTCDFGGKAEQIVVYYDPSGHHVSYSRNGRRIVDMCKSKMTEAAAIQHAYKIMAETTLK